MSAPPEVVKVLQSISTQRLARAPMSFTLGMLPHAALTFSMAGEDMALRNYRPLFVLDDSGVMKYSDMPLLASAPEHAPAPATLNAEPGLIAAASN